MNHIPRDKKLRGVRKGKNPKEFQCRYCLWYLSVEKAALKHPCYKKTHVYENGLIQIFRFRAVFFYEAEIQFAFTNNFTYFSLVMLYLCS